MRIGWAVAAVVLALSGCGAPEAPPVLIEASQVQPLLQFSDELNGQRVAVDGYVHINDGPEGSGGAAMLYTLTSRPRGQGDDLILFAAEIGTGPNQIDLPVLGREGIPGFPAAGEILTVDVTNARFRDLAGAAHSIRDKVRVTGRVASGAATADDRSPTGRRFRPRLTEVTFEAAP
ncbi:hypothetical protein [Brevundimonas sp.]|uniref:hypothetical protein n=1 Tax=Brevundimonas sp. TaxID=1871086 RepID=UPI002D64C46D|nr:hypothetical protein [Brevundimonas sp.]HYC68191.1 hypothetical protein [Brevundimonas sp.]